MTTTQILKLNNLFYSKDAIEETISAFSALCKIGVIDDSICVGFEGNLRDGIVVNEFSNFALALMKQKNISIK